MIPHPNPKVNIPALSRIPCRNLRKLPPKGGIGYDSWNGIGDRGAAAQCQRGGREAVRAGQMRHAASDGPGPGRCLARACSGRQVNHQKTDRSSSSVCFFMVLVKNCGLDSKIMSAYTDNVPISTKTLPPGGRWPSEASSEEERRNLKVWKMPEIWK